MNGLPEDSEAHFHWVMNDLEDLITQYGGDFLVQHCKIDNKKLFELYEALQKHYGVK